MIMGLRYWERLESTMTGEFANRLMALARRDDIQNSVCHPRLLRAVADETSYDSRNHS